MNSNDTEILLPFDFKIDEMASGDDDWKNRKGITFQVGQSYHERYLALQAKTKGRFGKKLKELVESAINQIDPPKTA